MEMGEVYVRCTSKPIEPASREDISTRKAGERGGGSRCVARDNAARKEKMEALTGPRNPGLVELLPGTNVIRANGLLFLAPSSAFPLYRLL